MSSSDVVNLDPRVVKAHGVHETPTDLANLLAELSLEALDRSSTNRLRVLDPACGSGELLAAVARRAGGSRATHLEGYESDPQAIERARSRLVKLPQTRLLLSAGDFLEAPTCREGYDLIVANPPFVRTQVLGARQAGELSRRFGLKGRVDLYQVFVQAMTASLRPGGVLGLIAPNRLLSVRSGASIRSLLGAGFDLRFVLDLGDSKLFKAAVLPVLIVAKRVTDDKTIANGAIPFVRVYLERPAAQVIVEADHENESGTVLDAIRQGVEGSCVAGSQRYKIERGVFTPPPDLTAAWSLTTKRDQAWLRRVEELTSKQLGEVGQVRVGIKTTADAVFVRDDWDELPAALRPEPALLKPLLTHHEARRWRGLEPPTRLRVLYPHQVVKGRRVPIELESYPGARAYLERHRERLESRSYVRKAGRRWYEVWVPQDPAAWSQPKLVFPDIAEQPRAYLDETGAVVQGDCYWLFSHDGLPENWLLLSLAVLNSTLATAYYDARFHNKLYGGRRRYITQYVAQFPLPDLAHPAAIEAVERVRSLVFSTQHERGARLKEHEVEIDRLVWGAFGLEPLLRR